MRGIRVHDSMIVGLGTSELGSSMATNKQTQIDYMRGPNGAHGIMAHCKYRRRPESEQEERRTTLWNKKAKPEKSKR